MGNERGSLRPCRDEKVQGAAGLVGGEPTLLVVVQSMQVVILRGPTSEKAPQEMVTVSSDREQLFCPKGIHQLTNGGTKLMNTERAIKLEEAARLGDIDPSAIREAADRSFGSPADPAKDMTAY